MGRRRRSGGVLWQRSAGFTILELMIATAVFSVVLLLVTVGITQITKVYYKGLTEANTQNTARTIIDTISQAIQFSGGDIIIAPNAVCVGGTQFTYVLGRQVENSTESANQTRHALVQGPASSGCSTAPDLAQENIDGRDLVGVHMRLANLAVELDPAGTDMYRVTVKVVYGDDDVLNTPTASEASCKGQSSSSAFCAVSELSTVVVKRIQ